MRSLALALAIFPLVVAPSVASAGTPATCAAAKARAAAAKVNAKVRCHSRALVRGRPVDGDCLSRADAKFVAAFSRVEASGGCATTNDADGIEALVDQLVTDLVGALASTTTTTTTTTTNTQASSTVTATTMCGPTSTVPDCLNACASFGLCAPGQTCGTDCQCAGPPVACGDLPSTLSGNVCGHGECPPGQTCRSVAVAGTCLHSCGCF